MPLEVTLANKNDEAVVKQLLQLHLHEQCPISHQELQDDGTFAFPGLEKYFDDPDRAAYLFRLKRRVAGFALVRTGEGLDGTPYHTIPEIFIIETYRGWGVGEECTRTIFDRHEGRWCIAVKEIQSDAMGFWRNVIWRYSGQAFKQSKSTEFSGTVFEFTSPPPVPVVQPMESLVDRPIVHRRRTRTI